MYLRIIFGVVAGKVIYHFYKTSFDRKIIPKQKEISKSRKKEAR